MSTAGVLTALSAIAFGIAATGQANAAPTATVSVSGDKGDPGKGGPVTCDPKGGPVKGEPVKCPPEKGKVLVQDGVITSVKKAVVHGQPVIAFEVTSKKKLTVVWLAPAKGKLKLVPGQHVIVSGPVVVKGKTIVGKAERIAVLAPGKPVKK